MINSVDPVDAIDQAKQAEKAEQAHQLILLIQLNQYINALSDYYQSRKVISVDEKIMFFELFQAFLAGDLNQLNSLFQAYAAALEDGLLVLAAFTQAVGAFTVDFGNHYSCSEGKLFLRTISKKGVSKAFSKFTGEETHCLEPFQSERSQTLPGR